ncbi:MAG: UDP-2,3-diacylglucosamine hydrolase [Motiliproteus sp.]|jgi:UDP-2,3-diacylglucosamine hydrolase
MSTLFISDLHLQSERPQITRAFYDFLNRHASQADALYILGDFFNVWLGDDAQSSLHREVAARLNTLSAQGTAVYLMHGNRDFLIGQDFCRQAGAILLDDPSRIDLYGTPALLMHGDSLCLDDSGYQRYRRFIRSPMILGLLRRIPLALRNRIANDIKSKSAEAKHYKPAQIMDVTSAEVHRQLQSAGLNLLIHGHTHRPDIHQLPENPQQQRIVLGDWEDLGWYLQWHANGQHQLISFPIPPDA